MLTGSKRLHITSKYCFRKRKVPVKRKENLASWYAMANASSAHTLRNSSCPLLASFYMQCHWALLSTVRKQQDHTRVQTPISILGDMQNQKSPRSNQTCSESEVGPVDLSGSLPTEIMLTQYQGKQMFPLVLHIGHNLNYGE